MPRRKASGVASALPAEWLAELSDPALRESAGPTVFSRGLAYWRDGAVELLRDDGTSASFAAHGSQTYAVELYFESPGLHVNCTCSHASDGNFCKHMVAAALVWRQTLGGEPPAEAATAPEDAAKAQAAQERMAKTLQTRAAKADQLRSFLAAQPAQALADKLWRHAQGNRDLMAELKGWAASAGAAGDPKALRRAVDELMKLSTRQFLEPAEVRAWAQRAEQALALLLDALQQRPAQAAEIRAVAESAMRVASSAFDRAYEVHGLAEDVYASFMRVVVDSLQASPPPAAWAEHLFQRMQGVGGWVWQSPEVLEAAGPGVGRAYSKLLAKRWSEEDARSAADKQDDISDDTVIQDLDGTLIQYNPRRSELRHWMTEDLERQGDLSAVYSFLKRSARGVVERMDLVQWCDEHGRPRDALQIAEANRKTFKNHPLAEEQLLKLYERDGWNEEALAIRQRRFDAQPSPDCYGPLMAAAKRAKVDLKALRKRCHEAAAAHERAEQQRLASHARRFGPHWTPFPGAEGAAGGLPAINVSWRAGFHVLDGELDEALALVRHPHTCDPRVLEALADALPESRNADAFALLLRCLNLELSRSKTPYREPLRLVAKARARLNGPDGKAWLQSLALTHKAKRTFVAALPSAR